MFRNIKYGIKNLIKWTPIVWKDRDYDYQSLLEMMKFKLENMEDFFRRKGFAIDAEKRADEMKFCVELLDRLINDVHFDESFDDFHKKWGEGKVTFEDEGEYSKLYIEYSNVKTPEDLIEMRKDLLHSAEIEDAGRKSDMKKLFDTLNSKLLSWWD
jgi:hypothetical protein